MRFRVSDPYPSIYHGEEMIRVSAFHQGEYFVLMPACSGRRLRERREEAAQAIENAIHAGAKPGEVKVRDLVT